MKIGEILLGRVNKRYSHDMSANNSTTFGFGNVQPLYCTYLHKSSDVKINMRQLLRPAPMISPTFGRVQAHTVTRFVAMKDIYPAFDALMAHKAIQGTQRYIPNNEPLVRNCDMLSVLMLNYCSFDIYTRDPATTKYKLELQSTFHDTTVIRSVLSKSIPTFNGLQDNYVHYKLLEKMSAHESELSLTPQSSDFVITDHDHICCFRLSALGRNIYKILVGLGYGLDYTNSNKITSLPIFAFYKAYFDTYYNKRFINWHDTDVYRVIQAIYNDGDSDYLLNYSNLERFLSNYTNLIYSAPADFVSVHTIDPLNGPTAGSTAPFSNIDVKSINSDGALARTNSLDGKVPNLDTSNRTTWYQLQALKKLTQYISKDSVIGGRVVDWFKVHFGVTPSEDMFLPSQFIDEHIVNLDIDDVFTTSDTYNPDTNTGSYTGSYAGKGLGYGQTNDEINFTAKDFGYLIILGALAPEQVYFSGDSPQLYGIDRYTLPNEDFDAMGYELTPYACIASFSASPFVLNDTQIPNYSLAGKSFGFIPRYSGFKVQKSVVNGDFSLRSVRDGLSSYYLDKVIDTREVSLVDGQLTQPTSVLPPTASTLWSYPTGIPAVGDYNRIFYNRGFPTDDETRLNWSTLRERLDDNFIFQSRFEVTVVNPFKPIRESYQIDDPEENSTSSVTAQ